jgi:predicted nucleotidyltransferase
VQWVINDTDKNVGPSISDKNEVVLECKKQLYNTTVYKKLCPQEVDTLISEIKNKLSMVVQKHLYKGSCSKKEAEFLKSKFSNFKIPHFYIIWKMHKNPIVGRPIVAL